METKPVVIPEKPVVRKVLSTGGVLTKLLEHKASVKQHQKDLRNVESHSEGGN